MNPLDLTGTSVQADATESPSSLRASDASALPHLMKVVDRAARRVAPLWPLDSFVAVNPFLGLTDHSFAAAARRMARVAGARLCMPRGFYVDAIRQGRITDRELAKALESARENAASDPVLRDHLPLTATGLKEEVLRGRVEPIDLPQMIPTVADAATEVSGRDWTTFVTERISVWAASHLDQGQASWGSPWRHASPWSAWRLEAEIDRTPEVTGVDGFRSFVQGLPEDVEVAIEELIQELGVPADGLELYLHRLLMDVAGWAGFLRYRLWQAELAGESDSGLHELLAIRLAWEVGLLRAFGAAGADQSWNDLRGEIAQPWDLPGGQIDLELDLVLQEAYEQGWQRALVERFAGNSRSAEPRGDAADVDASGENRPAVQAAFCIDVRSEPFRRALEAEQKEVETMGFAGFFGFPVSWEPLGGAGTSARCPVLLSPAATIREVVKGDVAGRETERLGRLRQLRRMAKSIWTSFKMGAVSCFAFVGPVGLGYARKLWSDGIARTRPVPRPGTDALMGDEGADLAPGVAPTVEGGRRFGMTLADRVQTAEGALRGMSLTDGFARVVLLAGHGATVVNNPHASGLDCGACGGHSGEANARIAAAVLNDSGVRTALAQRDILIPEDTWFLAGRHDTTTDEVVLLDTDEVPATHEGDVHALAGFLESAGRRCRAERAPGLGIGAGEDVDAAVEERSRDWSQVRPEWGLAGCAAFVAAPRGRTESLDLEGRAFLHDYEWPEDEGFGVLELIMTAPMVVASWISLQYYGSTVDNETFGCGNKTLHNIVASLGVLEGNGGDLRTGLPWQSVHDGKRYVHEPIRLNVVIEAPVDAMNAVLSRHDEVRALLDQGWLNLFALDGTGGISERYVGDLEWAPIERDELGDARPGTVAA